MSSITSRMLIGLALLLLAACESRVVTTDAPAAHVTTSTVGDVMDFVGDVTWRHGVLTVTGGHLLEVELDDVEWLFTGTRWSMTVTDVAWRSPSSSRPLEVGDRIEVTSYRPLEHPERYGDATTTAWVLVNDRDEVDGIGILDSAGAFISASHADSSFVAAGFKSLFARHGQDWVPAMPYCLRLPESPTFASEPETLVAWFWHLDARPPGDEAHFRRALTISAAAGVLEDPVSGLASAPSLIDLAHQLDSGVAEADLELRPSIPVRIRLVWDQRGSTEVVAFTALPSNRLLGWIDSSLAYDRSEWTVFIAPPNPDETVAVHHRTRTREGIGCIAEENPRPLLTIPYDAIAGDTRVILDLATVTYSTTTELPAE